jgi:ABC-type branched-subunit amino acid transport system ATPase component
MTLQATDVTVQFGGLTALKNVSLRLTPGTVSAVIGPNGAGKTTLVNVLTGLVRPTTGRIQIDGKDLSHQKPYVRALAGIRRSYQTPRLDAEATVFESVLVGLYGESRSRLVATVLRTPGYRAEVKRLEQKAARALDKMGMSHLSGAAISSIPLWQMRLIEVVRATVAEPRFLLLDEPAAGLDEDEQEQLREAIRRIAADGTAVLLIEHNFGFVRSLATDVTVLHLGQMLAQGTMADIESNPLVVDTYLGTTDEY